MTRYWLGVVQREHVLRGVELGIVQTNHGAKAGVARMQPGDGVAFYSPKTAMTDGETLREFTAIGTVGDGEPYQGDDGDYRPWRRPVDFDTAARSAPITPLLDVLEFTRGNKNWGFVLRRGQVEISQHDFAVIAAEMASGILKQ